MRSSGLEPRAPLDGVRIVDLSRILAGPTATQLLGDFGADVIKVEQPKHGDDTRGWGPPFVGLGDDAGNGLSSYFIAANRSKRSIELDLATAHGQSIIRQLASTADVLVENFKVGGLKKYGLTYEDLKDQHPQLIYCSITGFGQTGPWASRPGYDLLAQAAGGIMSITGEPTGEPMKVGVGIADMMCGMYAASAILAALRFCERTGRGQHIDISLLDCQVAWLANAATNYFVSGEEPPRWGNAHPNIVPYRVYSAADGHFVLAIGNDGQFEKWCNLVGETDLFRRFPTNSERVRHRTELEPLIEAAMKRWPRAKWDKELSSLGIPGGAVNSLSDVFDHPQVKHRGVRVKMSRSGTLEGSVDVLGNPVRFSEFPVTLNRPPPLLGEHTAEILSEISTSRPI